MVKNNQKLAFLYHEAFRDEDALDLAVDLRGNFCNICLDTCIVLIDMSKPVENLIADGQKSAYQENCYGDFYMLLQFQMITSVAAIDCTLV
jgi:hypothetical protein